MLPELRPGNRTHHYTEVAVRSARAGHVPLEPTRAPLGVVAPERHLEPSFVNRRTSIAFC